MQLFAFETTSWHLGDERCTIDLYAESLTAEQAEQVENVCNQVIRSGLPVLTHLVDQAGLAALPLRKPPREAWGGRGLVLRPVRRQANQSVGQSFPQSFPQTVLVGN